LEAEHISGTEHKPISRGGAGGEGSPCLYYAFATGLVTGYTEESELYDMIYTLILNCILIVRPTVYTVYTYALEI